jgi:hypothetical protein
MKLRVVADCKIDRQRTELHRAGVYFLFGRDESSNEIAIAYVGEAEEIDA